MSLTADYMFLTTNFKLSNLVYLGINLVESLNWNEQVDILCSKVNRSISGHKQARDYRKLPLISPGLIQLRKGFWGAYKWRGLYPGREGLISGIKTTFRNEPQHC